MKKALKWIGIILGSLILIVALTVVIFWVTLPEYKKAFTLSDNPLDGQGLVSITPDTWVIGTEDNTLVIEYTAGEEGIQQGGGLKIMLGQVLEYAGERHIYIPFSITAVSAIFFEIDLYGDSHIQYDGEAELSLNPPSSLAAFYDILSYIKYKRSEEGMQSKDNYLRTIDQEFALEIMVENGSILPGEKVIIQLGRMDGPGLKAPFRQSRFDVVVLTDGNGDGSYNLIQDLPELNCIATDFHWLTVVAKSTPSLNTPFQLLVRAQDDYYLPNVIPNYTGTIHFIPQDGIELPSTYTFNLEDKGVHKFEATIAEPGIYRIQVRDENGNLYTSNPIDARGIHPNVYFGDVHIHSVISYDADRKPQYIFDRQRDFQGYDFSCLTDHDLIGKAPFTDKMGYLGRTADEWNYLQQISNDNYEPGYYVPLIGYEWTSYNKGHRNVYYAPEVENPPLFCQSHPPYDTPEELVEALMPYKCFVVPHSTAWRTKDIVFDWGPIDFKKQKLVEIYSSHGTSEYFNNPFAVHQGQLEIPVESKLVQDLLNYNIQQGPADSGNFVQDALAAGYKMGFVGCGDLHYLSYLFQAYKPGITGVFADTLSRSSLWEAMNNRQTYATTGARILLYFSCNGTSMGEELVSFSTDTLQFNIEVLGTDIIQLAELVRYIPEKDEFETIFVQEPGLKDYQTTFIDQPPQTTAIYYVRVTQKNPVQYRYNTPNSVPEDYHQAWSSPIWVNAASEFINPDSWEDQIQR